MDFAYSDKTRELIDRLERFMDQYIYPNEKTYEAQMQAFRDAGNPWQGPQILEDLKPKAKEAVCGTSSCRNRSWGAVFPTWNTHRCVKSWAASAGRRKCSTVPHRIRATWKCSSVMQASV